MEINGSLSFQRNLTMKKFFSCQSRIKIKKQFSFSPQHSKPVLLIIQKNDLPGRTENKVCIVGNICDTLFELFELQGAHLEPTKLGKRFGAILTSNSRRIDISIHHRLKDLCKALHIKKVIITRSNPF